MLIRDSFTQALESFRHSPGRTLLTLLGIVIGTASVTVVISTGAMMKREFLESAEKIGGRLINVHQNYENADYSRRNVMLSERDVENLKALRPDADWMRSNYIWLSASRQGKSRPVQVVANDPVYWDMFPKQLVNGRFLEPGDEERAGKTAVLSADLAAFFFTSPETGQASDALAVGSGITLGPFEYTIVGVIDKAERASPIDDGRYKETVFIPYATLSRLQDWTWAGGPKLSELIVRARSMDEVREVGGAIDNYLRERYGEVDGQSRFRVEVIDGALSAIRKIFTAVSAAVLFLAGISLVVGGIGIMNVMLVAIAERTREIGIRKAVGASPAQILSQFLLEALLVCLSGGLAGLALGVAGTAIVSLLLGWEFILPLGAPVIAVTLSVATGLGFGFYPARQASRLEPVLALQAD